MEKDKNFIRFALQGIKTEQFAILEDNYNSKSSTELQLELQFNINQKSKQIWVILNTEFAQNKKKLLKIVMSCYFSIEEKSWKTFINEKDSKITIPKSFLAHLAALTIGTVRGALFAKIEGTPFSGILLPTINVNEIVKQDATYPLEK